ncbi:hypothetical protein KCV87_27260 [Actinosynnema pretiosum subsp. pretiosum]|uniref:Uncharacterized protein n=1 Tax=Actinosynnema pretiosum subsp. pretiosum TaxID=103721 RepID=A0AA45R2S7_9PSEU|nr:hypothetical protein APASM_5688 [Actinosynnema pretiosum subsp. pretiosum]QUF03091.1 hypothetical protein KCV87_27260 [Actinosynnema pretiosum subsp. pretiosum]
MGWIRGDRAWLAGGDRGGRDWRTCRAARGAGAPGPRRYWARRDALALIGDLPEAAPVLVAALGREPEHADDASHFERGSAAAFAELAAARCLRVPRPDLVPPLLEAARGPTPHRSALAVVLGRWRVVEAVPLPAEWVVGADEVGVPRR